MVLPCAQQILLETNGNHAFPVTAIVINLQDVADNCATHLWCAVRDGPQKKGSNKKMKAKNRAWKLCRKCGKFLWCENHVIMFADFSIARRGSKRKLRSAVHVFRQLKTREYTQHRNAIQHLCL